MAESTSDLVSEADRKRIASGARVTVALMIMVSLIVLGLTGLMFSLVSNIFDVSRPATESDLKWKVVRGAAELSRTAEVGLLLHDPSLVAEAAQDYVGASDVVNVLAVDLTGTPVFSHGPKLSNAAAVFKLAPKRVHPLGSQLVAWAPSTFEGQTVGKVAVVVSTARLTEGQKLRRQMLTAGGIGGLVALLLSIAFVTMYVFPVLRLTQAAFVRLEHTTHAALEAARLKAQFLANMSHEIRTPMNVVVGLAKLMLGVPLDAKIRRYAEMIDASSRSLLGIINDVLDFSKIEAGKYKVSPSPCEPALIVQEVAELLAERTHAKGVDLVYRIAKDVPRVVEADGDRIRQVLTNLVGNAVKFTECGEVYIQLLAEPRTDGRVDLRFEVRDSGIGIPREAQSAIFDAFSQADGSLVRKHGGTGLGLTISKQLTELMGGSIGLESELGKGSVFWFTLPLPVLNASSAIRAQPTSLGKRALIICDNEHAAASIEEHVDAWGMNARVARSLPDAQEAMRAALERGPHFDLVIISETRSGTVGQEVVTGLRRSFGERCPPVVVLAQLTRGLTRSELDEEVAAQLAQPVRMSELYECLSRVLLPSAVHVQTSRPARPSRPFPGARVLVVDDNEINQFVAVEHLTLFGCTVDQAMNGAEAVDAVLTRRYDLVLMDCQMPVMDGYTATREIRKRETGRRTPIVALTAHALQGERELVLDAGMDDYLTKPVRPVSLQRALERWVEPDAEPGIPQEARAEALEPAALAHNVQPENDVALNFHDYGTRLLELFAAQVPIQMEMLDGAIALAEVQSTRAHAHKLKGSLLSLDAHALAALAGRLQHMAETEDLSQAEAVFSMLLSGFQNFEQRVKAELARRASSRGKVSHV